MLHDITEAEQTTLLVEEAAPALALSSTLSPAPSTECPSCACSCPTLPPVTQSQATPYIMDNTTTSMNLTL